MFSLFHETGDGYVLNDEISAAGVTKRLRLGLAKSIVWNSAAKRPQADLESFQLQVFVTSDQPLSERQTNEIRDRFLMLREQFRQQWRTDASQK